MLKLTTPFANADEASINSLFGAASPALRGAEQLSALNLQATKTTLAEFAELVRATLSEKNPAELGKLQIAALQAAPEKALAYSRQVKEICCRDCRATKRLQAQLTDVQASLEAVGRPQERPGSENTFCW
jgi:phasin family protein